MTNKQKIYGLIGYPVKHSFSAAMHNAAFSYLGINAAYALFEIKPDDLEDFLLSRTDFAGFNITIPHKVSAKKILELNFKNSFAQADKYSELIGAINTVGRNNDGSVWWTNTDAPGFVQALKTDLGFKKTADKDALVFGCGGAGRAVISGLSWEDKGLVRDIYVYEISEQSKQIVNEHYANFPLVRDKLKFITQPEIAEKIKQCSLLVNTTPVGMGKGDVSVIDKNLLHDDLSVYDLVYNQETQLIKDAKQKGLKSAGGLSMLLYQGVLGFNYWADRDIAPVDIMRQALEGELEKCRT